MVLGACIFLVPSSISLPALPAAVPAGPAVMNLLATAPILIAQQGDPNDLTGNSLCFFPPGLIGMADLNIKFEAGNCKMDFTPLLTAGTPPTRYVFGMTYWYKDGHSESLNWQQYSDPSQGIEGIDRYKALDAFTSTSYFFGLGQTPSSTGLDLCIFDSSTVTAYQWNCVGQTRAYEGGLAGVWPKVAVAMKLWYYPQTDPLPPSVMHQLQHLVLNDGQPNPRVSCTEGNFKVRTYLQDQMAMIGLKPLPGLTGFLVPVPETVDAQFCTEGLANVMGIIEGSDPNLKGEYIMLDAHYDGPNDELGSEGKSYSPDQPPMKKDVQVEFGNTDTDDAYDDAGAVACILVIAKALKATPPKRSVIISFTDAEEGLRNIGTPPLGSRQSAASQSDTIKNLIASRVAVLGKDPDGGQFPIGFTFWAKSPSFDVNKIKLIISADPWGKPGVAGSDFVAILGAESTPGLQDAITKAWPASGTQFTQKIFVNRQFAASSYSDVDAVTLNYNTKWSPPLVNGGVPFVWMAQTGFQSYHGGLHLSSTFKGLVSIFKDLATEQGFFSNDRLCSIHPSVINKMSDTMQQVIISLANSDDLSNLKYKRPMSYDSPAEDPGDFTVRDAQNVVDGYSYLIAALQKGHDVTGIPQSAANKLIQHMTDLKTSVQAAIPPGPVPFDQLADPQVQSVLRVIQGFVIALDFFRDSDLTSLTPFNSDLDHFPPKCANPPIRRK